jgi:hypothetical protein
MLFNELTFKWVFQNANQLIFLFLPYERHGQLTEA